MTYGELPPFEEFERDIRRPDPEKSDGGAYWPEGTLYPMELVNSREVELAEDFGLEPFETERYRSGRNSRAIGFRGNERQIYDFLEYLISQDDFWGEQDASESPPPADLASSIMTTLGYEWI